MRCSCGLWGVRTNVFFFNFLMYPGWWAFLGRFWFSWWIYFKKLWKLSGRRKCGDTIPKKISFLFILSNVFLKNKGICDRIFHFQKLCCHLVIFRQKQNHRWGPYGFFISLLSFSYLLVKSFHKDSWKRNKVKMMMYYSCIGNEQVWKFKEKMCVGLSF
jgi:hypothetical protein